MLYARPQEAGPAPDLRDLRAQLAYCCEAFQACHYSVLGRNLPPLLVLAQGAAHRSDGAEVQVLLSRTLQLAASFLHKYGAATAVQAAVAADRALAAADRSGDPVAIGAASRRVAKSLIHQQQPESAAAFAVEAATRLTDDLAQLGPIGLSTLGMLYLNAAIAEASTPRTTAAVRRATGHVDHADEVADRRGVDLNADWTNFGPTNCDLHRIDVLTRFEDGWSALEAADGLSGDAVQGLKHERRARHLVTMARAQLLTRRKEEAAKSLAAAMQIAPEEVAGRQSVVNLVQDVVGATAAPSAELRHLADRCGLRA